MFIISIMIRSMAGVGQLPRAETTVCSTRKEMQTELRNHIQAVVNDQNRFPGNISIGLSGGSMPMILGPVFSQIKIDPKRLRLFLVDERIAVDLDPETNFSRWMWALPSKFHNCLAQVDLIQIPNLPDKKTFPYHVGMCAAAYDSSIPAKVNGRHTRFDMLFLGMGPDGHTASIFPHGELFRLKHQESATWFVGVEDAPKPSPRRVTMTLHSINSAAHVAFICTGEDKANVIKAVLDREPQYPASYVSPINGTLRFFLDPPAAAEL